MQRNSPTQYELFVARVLGYATGAQESAKEARNAAAAAKQDADTAATAGANAARAAKMAQEAAGSAQSDAERGRSRAADRAENFAPPRRWPGGKCERQGRQCGAGELKMCALCRKERRIPEKKPLLRAARWC